MSRMSWDHCMRFAAVVLVFVSLSGSAFAATYYVPDDFSTIQAGLDGATDGETSVVRDGIYTGGGNRDLPAL